MRTLFAILGVGLVVSLSACGKGGPSKGACEYTYPEGSTDGSIPKGMQTCAASWVENMCNEDGTGQAGAGLKTNNYVFSAGKKCEDLGYKDCDGRGFYKKSCEK